MRIQLINKSINVVLSLSLVLQFTVYFPQAQANSNNGQNGHSQGASLPIPAADANIDMDALLKEIQEGRVKGPSGMVYDTPSKTRQYAMQGQQFVTGMVGFMIGSQIECFGRAQLTGDPMVMRACQDSFASLHSWVDLAVFSAASQATTMSIQAAAKAVHTHAYKSLMTEIIAKSAIRALTFNQMMTTGISMTAGSVVQHFWVKYSQSEEIKERKKQDREWGFWAKEYADAKAAIWKLETSLGNSKLTKEKRDEIYSELKLTKEKQKLAFKKIQEHRTLWYDHLDKSFAAMVKMKEGEVQQLLIDSTRMVISSILVGQAWQAIKMGASQTGSLASRFAAEFKDPKIFYNTMDRDEKLFVFEKYKDDLDLLKDKKQQQKAMAEVMKQRIQNTVKNQPKELLPMKMQYTHSDQIFLKGPGLQYSKKGMITGYVSNKDFAEQSAKLSWGRKAYLRGSVITLAIGASAMHAIPWLVTDGILRGFYMDVGYKYTVAPTNILNPMTFTNMPLPSFVTNALKSTSKAIKLYKLEDRVADAKKEVLLAAETMLSKVSDVLKITREGLNAQKTTKTQDNKKPDDVLKTLYEQVNKLVDEQTKEFEKQLIANKTKNMTADKALEFASSDEFKKDVQEFRATITKILKDKINAQKPQLMEEHAINNMPEEYKSFIEKLGKLHEVFKLYREEVILRKFNEHYMAYVQKKTQKDDEFYKLSRFIRWFMRGKALYDEKTQKFEYVPNLEDPDYVANGSADPAFIAENKEKIENPQHPLHGMIEGKPWHEDIQKHFATSKDEFEKMQSDIIDGIKDLKKKENAKRGIRGVVLSMQDYGPQGLQKLLDVRQKELESFHEELTSTLTKALKEQILKILPLERGFSNPSGEETALEKSYEYEFKTLRELVYEISQLAPQSELTKKFLLAVKAAEAKCDGSSGLKSDAGSHFNCSGFHQGTTDLREILKDFDGTKILSMYNKNDSERLNLVMVQIYNYMHSLKNARYEIYKQRESIFKLDIQKAGEFNNENVLMRHKDFLKKDDPFSDLEN